MIRGLSHLLLNDAAPTGSCCSSLPLADRGSQPLPAVDPGPGPYWNLFAYPVRLGSAHYVFLTDTKSVVTVDEQTFGDLAGAQGRTVPDRLTAGELTAFHSVGLVRNEAPAAQLTQVFARSTPSLHEYELLHIITSYTCNLTCSYCFMLSNLGTDQKLLSFDDAKRGIDLYFSRPHKPDSVIHFYGGEPLLHPRLIDDCLSYIVERYSASVIPKLITNGTLYGHQILDLLDRYDFDLSVSMDGDREAHDVFRVDRAGRSTFDKTIEGIRAFQSRGHNPKVLVTVGEHNVHRLPEIVDKLCDLQPHALALNFPRELPSVDNNLGDEAAELTFWVDQYARSLEVCYERGVPELYFADMLFATLTDTPVLSPCAACGKQISVGPGAQIGPCQAFVAAGMFSQPIEEFDETSPTGPFAPWQTVSKTMSTKCSRCPIAPICGGDCSFDRYNRTGSLNEPLPFHCDLRLAMAHLLAERLVSGQPIGFTPAA